MKKKIVVIIAVSVLIISGIIVAYNYYGKNNVKNWDLVFDAKYYADLNSDIEEACGGDEQKLLEHFVNYGMRGRKKGFFKF